MMLAPLAIAVAGCAPNQPTTKSHPHTGITVVRSASFVHVVDAISRVEVAAVVLSKGTVDIWLLKTFVTRQDLNYPEINSAWSAGNPIAYRLDDERRVGRARQETGRLPMSRRLFERYQHTGFTFVLMGSGGRYLVEVPGKLFAQALVEFENHGATLNAHSATGPAVDNSVH